MLGGREFRFKDDLRPTVAMLIAEPEYQTSRTLPEFAAKELGKDFRVSLIFGSETDRADIPGFEAIGEADVLLVSVRRRPLKPEQMKVLHDWVSRGKPVVGIRTACHAFSLRGKEPKAPLETWESWDPDVFGGHYVGHHGKESEDVDSSGGRGGLASDFERRRRRGSRGERSALPRQSLGQRAQPLLIGTIPGQTVRAGRVDFHSGRRRQIVLHIAGPSGRFRRTGIPQAAAQRAPLGRGTVIRDRL